MTGQRWTSENNPGLSAEVILKADRAVRLKAAGWTYDKIAEEVGYSSRTSAHRAVQSALKRISNSADVLERRALESERLEFIWRKNAGKAGDPKHDATLLRVSSQQASLWGLNANEAKVADGIYASGMAELAKASMLSALLVAAMGEAGVEPDVQERVVLSLNARLEAASQEPDEDVEDSGA